VLLEVEKTLDGSLRLLLEATVELLSEVIGA
jgi:hypothetical protein